MRVKCRGFSGWIVLLEYTDTTESGIYYRLKLQQETGEYIEIKRINTAEIEVINAKPAD